MHNVSFFPRYFFSPVELTDSPANFINVFPSTLWALILAVLIFFCLLFLLFHSVYNNLDRSDGELGLVKKGLRRSDVVLKTVCTLTEPEGIPFFPRWSAGVWTIKLCTKHETR